MDTQKYKWYASGDINAFFGLMLDNIAGLVLTVTMLSTIFSFPVEFAIRYMVPGTAIGVLVGDLLFFFLAFRLAKKEGRSDVTAMPLGLDTPSTIGMVLFVLGPAFAGKLASLAQQAGVSIDTLRAQIAENSASEAMIAQFAELEFEAAMFTWQIGICAIFLSGLIKLVASFGSEWIRQSIPRAGLLGSLAAIALVLIAFLQVPRIAAEPIVGFSSLIIVLATLVARGELPFKIPGALGAVGVGCIAAYILFGIDAVAETHLAPHIETIPTTLVPTEWLEVFSFQWLGVMPDAFAYMPYIVPFAIATVIGGIDCTESAAAAGDSFDTRKVIGIEAIATLVAALFGGVIQTTPYIGHPAYKSMGGRAAYTLGTAIFVGGAGVLGYFSVIFQWIPEAALLPILVFIGLEITAQSFHATPKRHYSAIAIACLPTMAKLAVIQLGPNAADQLTLRMLAGGFIMTSVIWAAVMASITDRRFAKASLYLAVGGVLVLFGVMHSPLDGDKMFWPWNIGATLAPDGTTSIDGEMQQAVIEFSVAYFVMAGLLLGLSLLKPVETIDSDEAFDKIAGH